MARRSMGRDKEAQTLAEVVVTPRGNYSVYTGEESSIPALSGFFEAKAREARINAPNHI